VINPSNPTGQVLTYQNVKDIVKFAAEVDVPILADEVYQTNVYEGSFVSCRSVAARQDINARVASIHSASKGSFGECGMRGGYIELYNFNP
jgi:aspartate/methionine/tyrosine aminotransferase